MPDRARCDTGLEETVEHVFFHCKRGRVLWDYVGGVIAYISCQQFMLLDVACIVDNSDSPSIVVNQRVIWTMLLKELYDGLNFSNYDLISFLSIR